jgi:hypothetical protein
MNLYLYPAKIQSTFMRIGIVLHGPEIIDAGSAGRIIHIFRQENEVVARLGGTMGRTAVLDSGLEEDIDISQGFTPSETILALNGKIELAILLNQGKTLETGRYFGSYVASKLSGSCFPLVHIESPDSSGRIIYYTHQTKKCAEYIRKTLMRHCRCGKYDLPIEQGSPLRPYVRREGNKIIRRISGAFPGETIRLDGIVIGSATREEPEIICVEGRVVELRGGDIKPHGLSKLATRKIDLFKAKIKTGSIRRTKCEPRVKASQSGKSPKTAAIIDHCAESTFELIKDADLVITVGDDTTAIAADILARFGIPIIGITDGDLDNILENSIVPGGSVIIRVREGFDDILGREVSKKLMGEEQKIQVHRSYELLARVISLAKKYIVDIKYY